MSYQKPNRIPTPTAYAYTINKNGGDNTTDIQSLIGKTIIRRRPANTHYGFDYSYCLNGRYCFQPNDWVYLIDIINECLVIKSNTLPDSSPHTLDREWNDGAWFEWNVDKREFEPPKKIPVPVGRFDDIGFHGGLL